jgi:glycerol uptake facilitator-like aquaporin
MVGTGLTVQQFPGDQKLAGSLMAAVAIAGSLVGLIVSLGKISGGHFNPLITVAQWLQGQRNSACTVAYVFAQIIGGLIGSLIARFIFSARGGGEQLLSLSTPLATSELVAACGLLIVVLGCARSSKWETGPFAVGSWLTAAIMATPSTSYANPAVTIAAAIAAGPSTLSAGTAAGYVVAQIIGMAMAIVFAKFVFAETDSTVV